MANTSESVKTGVDSTNDFVAVVDQKAIHQSASHGELKGAASEAEAKTCVNSAPSTNTNLAEAVFRSRGSSNSDGSINDNLEAPGNSSLIPAALDIKSPHVRKVSASSLYEVEHPSDKESVNVPATTKKLHDLNINVPPPLIPKNSKRRSRSESSLIGERPHTTSSIDQTQYWPKNSPLFDQLRDIEKNSPYSNPDSSSDHTIQGGLPATDGSSLNPQAMKDVKLEHEGKDTNAIDSEGKNHYAMAELSTVMEDDTKGKIAGHAMTAPKTQGSHTMANLTARVGNDINALTANHPIAASKRKKRYSMSDLPTHIEDSLQESAIEYAKNPLPTAVSETPNSPNMAGHSSNQHSRGGGNVKVEALESSSQQTDKETSKESSKSNAKGKAKAETSSKDKSQDHGKGKGKERGRSPSPSEPSSGSEYEDDTESGSASDESSDLDDPEWFERKAAEYKEKMAAIEAEEQAELFKQQQIMYALTAWAETGAERESQRGAKRVKTAAEKGKAEEMKVIEKEKHLKEVFGKLSDVIGMIPEDEEDDDSNAGEGPSGAGAGTGAGEHGHGHGDSMVE